MVGEEGTGESWLILLSCQGDSGVSSLGCGGSTTSPSLLGCAVSEAVPNAERT